MATQPTITATAYSESLVQLMTNRESCTLIDIVADLNLAGRIEYANGDSANFSVNGYVLTGSNECMTVDFHQAIEISIFHKDNSIKFVTLDADNIEKMVQEYTLRNDATVKCITLDVFAHDSIDPYMTNPIVNISMIYHTEKTIIGKSFDFIKRLMN